MFLTNTFKKKSIDVLPEFNSNFDFSVVDDELKKILRDIMSILTLRAGSLIYQPDVGTKLFDYMWENITKDLISKLELEMKYSLEASLNIKLKSLKVERDKTDVHQVNISLSIILSETSDLDIILFLSKQGVITVEKASKVISKIIIQ